MPARIPVGTFSPFEPKQTSKSPPRWEARSKYRQSENVLRDVEKTGSSRGEVMRKMTERFQELANERTRAEHVTVGAFARSWVNGLSEDRLSSGTIRVYRQTVTKHIEHGSLSTIALADLTVDDCATYLDGLVLSAGMSTAKQVRACLRGCLDLAVRKELTRSTVNPVRAIPALVAPRGYVAVPKEVKPTQANTDRALTREERDRLVAYAYADDFAQRMDLADLIAFMAGTGVRLGEACALADDWLDLDDEPAMATIGYALIRRPGEGLFRRPWTKTFEGLGVGAKRPPRPACLPPWLADRLRVRREREGYFDAPEGVVFPSPRGHLRDVENTAGDLKQVYVAAGFPWATSHSFRRTVNTLLREADLDGVERSKVLGHVRLDTKDKYYEDRFHPVKQAASIL